MAADNINKLVSEKAFKEIDDLISKLGESEKLLVDNVQAALQFNTTLSGSKGLKELEQNNIKAQKSIETINKTRAQTELIEARLAQVRTRTQALYEKEINRQIELEERRIAVAQRKTQTVVSNSQAEIDASLKSAKGQDNITHAVNATDKAQGKAANSATAMGGAAKKANDTTQKGYKASNAAIEASIKSINTLTIRLQSYKNVAQFATDPKLLTQYNAKIQATERQIEKLSNVGKEGFDQFGNAIKKNSWAVSGLLKNLANLLPGIGVGSLIAFGTEPLKKYILSLDAFKVKLTDAQKEGLKLNEALQSTEYQQAVTNVNELTINIDLAKKGFLDKEKVLKQYNETIGKTTGEVGSLDEAERALIKNGNAYIQITLLKAAAQLALEDAAKKSYEAEIKRQEKNDTPSVIGTVFSATGVKGQLRIIGQNLGILEKQYDVFQDERDKDIDKRVKNDEEAAKKQLSIARKFQEEAAKIAKEMGFDFFSGTQTETPKKSTALQDSLELNRVRLESAKKAAEDIFTNEKESLQKRLEALKVFEGASTQLLLNEQRLRLSEEGLSATKRLTITEDTNNKIKDIEIDVRNKRDKAIADADKKEADRQAKILNEALEKLNDASKAQIAALITSNAQKAQVNSEYADQALLGLAEQFGKGIISEQEYANERLKIQKQLTIDTINDEIFGVEQIIALQKASGFDTSTEEQKLAELKKKLSKETTDQQISDLEELGRREKELRDKKIEFAQELANLTFSLFTRRFDLEDQQLEKEAENIDIRKEKEIDLVDRSLASEEEKAAKIAIIEARAQARKEAIDRRQRQLDAERARFDRLSNIAGIIGNTARGITSALALFPPNVPLSILIGAIGAAQIAQVLATPLPKFEEGGKMAYTGLAEYGHGTELRIDPDGKVSLTPSTPEVGIVQKDTEFISNKNLMRMFAKPDQIQYVGGQAIDIKTLIEEQRDSTKQLKAAYGKANKQPIITDGAIKRMGKIGMNWNSYINRNFS